MYNMNTKSPIFSIFCIDYRFDAMVATFYEGIGKEYDYFACTVAGGAMPLGYEKYCKNECLKCNKSNKSCNPSNPSMKLLKKNLVENLNIALTLKPITETYLLNHQDCGAIKAFLGCSGYPKTLGKNNSKEIKINSKLLTYANNYMLSKFPNIKFTLGLVDINGTVATYDIKTKTWTVIYIGEFHNKDGLWYGLKINEVYKD
jgi:hypothetical protein